MLIRRTLLYLPAQVVGPAAQLLAIFVFTHWMAPDSYGVFTYILASQDFVFLLCLSWWSTYTVRYFSGGGAADARYRDAEGAVLAASCLLMALASLVALLFISAPMTPGLCAAAILSTGTRCLALHLGERARAQSLIVDYTVSQAAGPVLGFALAFLTVARISDTPEAALFAYAVAQGAALVWQLVRQRVRLTWSRPDRALVRQALAFGLPLIGAGVAAWFGMNAIRIILDREMGAAAMGLVAVGWNLGHRLTTTAAMFLTVAAFPLAVETFRAGARTEAYRQITANGVLMLGLVLPASVGLWMVQGPLVDLLVAAPFRATTLAILPAALAAGLFRNIRTHVADQVLLLVERTPIVGWTTLGEAILVVLGCAAGLALGGTTGAAYGAAVGYGIAMVAGFAIACVATGLRLPYGESALVALAVGLMAAVLALLPMPVFAQGPWPALGLKIAVGAGVYGAAILLLFPGASRFAWSRWRQRTAR